MHAHAGHGVSTLAAHEAYRGIAGDLRLFGRAICRMLAFSGRSSRTEFVLYYVMASLLAGVLIAVLPGAMRHVANMALNSAVLLPMPALIARRWHDMGKSIYWSLPGFAVVAATLYSLYANYRLGPNQSFSLYDGTGAAGFIVGAAMVYYFGMLILGPPKDENPFGADPRLA